MGSGATWYRFVRWLVRTVYFGPITGGLRSVGENQVPREGAVIVAPLHVSHLDPPAVACGTKRQLAFMAKEELFKGIFGKIIASLGAFPVRRGEGDTESIRRSIALLEEGRALLLFPEGTRGDGVSMQPINRGVAMLAKRTQALVVPVGVVGTHIVMPRGRKGRRHRITIAYGEPFRYSDVATRSNDKENRDAFAAELEKRIRALCAQHGLELRSASPPESKSGYPAPEKAGEGPEPPAVDTRIQP